MNLTSFLQLCAVGLLVASGPLAYVLVKGDVYRKLVWVLLFLTFDLILFGGFTRLTDSGLGCPDWPGCYGLSNPVAAQAHIAAAEAAMPTGPVTVVKAWIEMLHRYLAGGVGVLTIALLIITIVHRVAARRAMRAAPPVWPAAALLALICVQGAFGAWTVTLKLMPAIVTTHLLLAITFLCAIGWLAARLQPVDAPLPSVLARKYRVFALVCLAVLFMQIALGGWVSTNYAVLACPDLPLCHGQVIPQADFAAGFTLWRPLGVLPDGTLLPAAALTAIHWTHRMGALVVFLVVGTFAGMFSGACKRAGASASYERKLARVLNWVLLLQLASGISNVLFAWPLAIAVAHNGGAAALALTLTMLNSRLAMRTHEQAQARPVPGAIEQRRVPLSSQAG
ncbi:MAG TPA: COX15/CtaA family protein [Burkholderiales bacterium]|nr:COX15/CtaA family protein [Burkholderiales bacterium]